MLILGIETSCDETAAAVVEDGYVIHSNVISSQLALHQEYGGVVPELAARAQITAILPVLESALNEANVGLTDVDAIAFTQGPGLAGSLLVGVNVAKTLSASWSIPAVGINHLEAHIYANWLQNERDWVPEFPVVSLLVSGGHTELVLLNDHQSYQLLGSTIDDAAGEAFDKGARLMGLGYPGGPAIQKAAATGNPDAFGLPRSWLDTEYDFSFSGLKTALLRAVEPWRLPDPPREHSDVPFPPHHPPQFSGDLPVHDLAASFQQAIVEVLARKTARAAHAFGARSVVLAGGVAANSALRTQLSLEIETVFSGAEKPELGWPSITLCTDNAAMIAGLGYHRFTQGIRTGLDADAYPRWPIGSLPPK